MRYAVLSTSQYKKSLKRFRHDKAALKKLERVIDILATGSSIPTRYKDHKLKGDMGEYRELHVQPDLLLVYQREDDVLILVLVDIGSHSKLFNK